MGEQGGGKTSVLCSALLFVNGQIISKFQSVYHYDKGETLLNFYCTSLRICSSIISFLLRPADHYKVSVTLLLAPENPAPPRFQSERLSLSPPAMTHTFPYVWPSFLQTYSFQWRANQLTCV